MTRAWRLVVPAILGGLLAGVWIGARCERAAARRMRRDGPRPDRMLKMFTRALQLHDDQPEAVRKVLESKRPAFQAVRRDMDARMAALRAEIDAEISPLLDDAQRKRQDAMRARWLKRVKEPVPPPDAR